MTWGMWLAIWAVSLAFTGIVALLASLLGGWALVIVFGFLIIVGGLVVTR